MAILNIPDNIIDHDDLREYIINCISMEELESFYNDMETEGGSITIPDRAIEVTQKRPTSRNTHYMLTSTEAKMIKTDPRVVDIQRTDFVKSSIKMASYSQSATFSKAPPATSISSTDINWGLFRCIQGYQIDEWGDNTGQYNQSFDLERIYTGKNVDVVIIDGITNVPNHPEFSKNPDGTGGTRYVQYNWYQLNVTVGNIINNNGVSYYNYNDVTNPNDELYRNHGTHVVGTVAGNTNGWATEANIYQISPYGFGLIDPLLIWDYIRAFHRTKPINPLTGRKNPTICNCSYSNKFSNVDLLGFGFGNPVFGLFRDVGIGETTLVNGLQEISGRTLSEDELNRIGILNLLNMENGSRYFVFPYYNEFAASDISQAISEGIIVVGAAGNESFFVDLPNGVDYNNQLYFAIEDPMNVGSILLTAALPYHRGSVPACVPGVITVGAVSADSTEKISSYTNKGPRIDTFAPGDWIISSVATTSGSQDIQDQYTGTVVSDSRNSSYYIGRDYGTSMASAQVAGILACLLEVNPSMTPTDALNFIKNESSKFQIPQDSDDVYYADSPVSNTAPSYFSTRVMNSNYLLGSPNKYAKFRQFRASEGELYPPENYRLRPSSGIVFPRRNIRIVAT